MAPLGCRRRARLPGVTDDTICTQFQMRARQPVASWQQANLSPECGDSKRVSQSGHGAAAAAAAATARVQEQQKRSSKVEVTTGERTELTSARAYLRDDDDDHDNDEHREPRARALKWRARKSNGAPLDCCQAPAATAAPTATEAYCCCCCKFPRNCDSKLSAAAAAANGAPARPLARMIRSLKSARQAACMLAPQPVATNLHGRPQASQCSSGSGESKTKVASSQIQDKQPEGHGMPTTDMKDTQRIATRDGCDTSDMQRQAGDELAAGGKRQPSERAVGARPATTSSSCSDSERLKADDEDDEEEDAGDAADGQRRKRASGTVTPNRWSRHSAGCSSRSLSFASSSLSSLSSLNSLAPATGEQTRRQAPWQPEHLAQQGTCGRPVRFSQLIGGAGSTSVSALSEVRAKRRPAPLPPREAAAAAAASPQRPAAIDGAAGAIVARRSRSASDFKQQQQQRAHEDEPPSEGGESELLSEQEVHAIEHFLRSHKSSVYVCGCMANLYFTRTHLADNGRTSRVASGEWRLNKTGVPVLIFDSGLARNRQRRRLSISLAERGSGFVLWSDTIDHLSNYRAFSTSLHSLEACAGQGAGNAAGASAHHRAASQPAPAQTSDTCDSFHVMYLSSNHRIMVGLSFDNPLCARLFLAQIELVCADPSNIALTGPKSCGQQQQQQQQQPMVSSSVLRPTPLVAKPAAKLAAAPKPGGALSTTRAKLTSKLKLLSLLRHRAPRRTGTPATNQAAVPTSLASWSTLRRAARRGLTAAAAAAAAGSQQRAAGVERRPVCAPPATAALAAASRPESERALLEAFKPRPLAQLAAEGKVWSHKKQRQQQQRHAGPPSGSQTAGTKRHRRQLKKIPRKCDISAPCLFQHITSVDSERLEQLYSKSFVLERQLECAARSRTSAATSGGPSPSPATGLAADRASGELEPQPEVISRASAEREAPECESPERPEPIKRTQDSGSSSSSSSSSSSCYSSGSSASRLTSCTPRSPASSDIDRQSAARSQASAGNDSGQAEGSAGSGGAASGHACARPQQLRGAKTRSGSAKPQLGLMAVRPLVAPPKPPERQEPMAARQLSGAARSTFGKPRASSCAPPAGRTQINSIISELQAQVPRELVAAKRRLLADIANRVGPATGPSPPALPTTPAGKWGPTAAAAGHQQIPVAAAAAAATVAPSRRQASISRL